MGAQRTGKSADDLSTEEHEKDFETLKDYSLVLIEVGAELDDYNLLWLEKYLAKIFRQQPNERLLNSGVGWLNKDDENTTLVDLLSN
jgi:hypothetical protein